MNFKVNLRHQYTSSLNTLACITSAGVQYSFDYFFEVKGGASGKEPTCQCRRHKRCRFDLWVRKIPWRRAWQLQYSCLVNPSGQRSLAGYSPWTRKELDMTEVTVHSCMHNMYKSEVCF